MVKRDHHSFKKHEKELERKKKLKEKLALRQYRKDPTLDDHGEKENTD
jgi:hypothetical protein